MQPTQKPQRNHNEVSKDNVDVDIKIFNADIDINDIKIFIPMKDKKILQRYRERERFFQAPDNGEYTF